MGKEYIARQTGLNNEIGIPGFVYISSVGPRKKAKIDAILAALPKIASNSKCLDIGTSHGALAYHFAKEGQWTFLDPHRENLQLASTILKGGFVSSTSESYLQDKDAVFDIVTCFDVIMYFEDPKAILTLFLQALKPGGRLIVSGVGLPKLGFQGWIRRRLGLTGANEFKIDPDLSEFLNIANALPVKIENSVTFCGPFTQFLQSLQDAVSIAGKVENEGLVPTATAMKINRKHHLALLLIKLASLTVNGLDRMLPVTKRYGYIVSLIKKPT